MTFNEFKQSLSADQSPDVRNELVAMWLDAKGNWDKAHKIVQDMTSNEASWVHAYLHRKEGDIGNAGYWYSRADRPAAEVSLEDEWEQIVSSFL